MTGNLHEDLCKFMIISRAVLLRMRNISDKTHFVCKNIFPKVVPFKRYWGKNTVQPDRP